MRSTSKRGTQGEDLAVSYLESQGYRIVARNWHTRGGEIDIVACAPSGEWAFVEVKTRSARRGDIEPDPLESMTPRKRRSLILAAYAYARQANWPDDHWRIDVIAVMLVAGNAQIEHITDALDW